MAIIGNFILIVASILYFSLISALYLKNPPRGGDAAMGYFWGIIIINLAFFVCMALVTVIIGFKGGLEWISPNKLTRYLFAGFGLLVISIASALFGLFKYENGPVPFLFRFFSTFGPALIPFVLIVAAVVLLNSQLRMQVPVVVYKWPLILISLIGLFSIVSGLGSLISESINREAVRQESTIKQHNENNIRMMQDIDSFDVMNNLAYLLVFTDGYKDAEVKDKAVTKVKTHPNWQNEIVGFLKNENAPDAFNFLASNDVDSIELFIEPVRTGIIMQAKLIRENIKRCSHIAHFYPGQ